ncbi:MAG TPA: AI-2E family transporter [Terriglobales bacterium]|nr:AI-2E family transporter [Terriglobales bacterium]
METAPNGRGLVIFTLAVLAGLALAWYLSALVLLVYASVLFAVIVSPMVEWVERRRVGAWKPGRGLALTAVLLGGLAVIALVLLVILPPLWAEGLSLVAAWPQLSARALNALRRLPGLQQASFAHVESYLSAASGWALGLAQHVASAIADLFTVLLLTAYLLIEGKAALAWCLRLIPPVPRARLARTLDRGQQRMRGWLLGQATLALALGGSSAIVFGALRLPDFYVLALMAGMLNFVPILGPFTAAAIVSVVAGVQSWASLAGVLLFFGAYQLVENAFLTPRIMRNAVDLPGLAVIVALAIGAALGGVLGALLAVPSAALAAELLAEYAMRG